METPSQTVIMFSTARNRVRRKQRCTPSCMGTTVCLCSLTPFRKSRVGRTSARGIMLVAWTWSSPWRSRPLVSIGRSISARCISIGNEKKAIAERYLRAYRMCERVHWNSVYIKYRTTLNSFGNTSDTRGVQSMWIYNDNGILFSVKTLLGICSEK